MAENKEEHTFDSSAERNLLLDLCACRARQAQARHVALYRDNLCTGGRAANVDHEHFVLGCRRDQYTREAGVKRVRKEGLPSLATLACLPSAVFTPSRRRSKK